MGEVEEEIMIMKEMSTTVTTLLPQEIIMEILLRIPAKSLISSFKLVCKPWLNLIQDPVFIKMHLNQGASRSNNKSSLICKSGEMLFQLHPPFNFEGLPSTIPPTKLNFDSLLSSSRLVGSCNGLLCIHFPTDETILLLNPSTRKFKVSPRHLVECPYNCVRCGPATYGFGCCYNSINNIDEYKVIRIVIFTYLDHDVMFMARYQFDIYCMSSNSWRKPKICRYVYPYIISTQQSGIFINGAHHWVARCAQTGATSTDSWNTIVSFDIRVEDFGQVPIPLSCHPTADDPYFHMNDVILMNMEGCLSMIRFSHGNNSLDLEIWVMKEYGIKESWTEEFVIRSSNSDPARTLSDFAVSLRSNAYVLKGDQVLIEGRTYTNEGGALSSLAKRYIKFVLYDINEKKIDGDFKMIGVPDDTFFDQVDYIESLVSLKSSVLPLSYTIKIRDMESIRKQQYDDIKFPLMELWKY